MTREEILNEAKKCVCGKREQDYGSPESNFGLIADLWSVYLRTDISEVDVSMMMGLLKIARIKNGGGTGDSFVDLAGYAACGGELNDLERCHGRYPWSEPGDDVCTKDPACVVMPRFEIDPWKKLKNGVGAFGNLLKEEGYSAEDIDLAMKQVNSVLDKKTRKENK